MSRLHRPNAGPRLVLAAFVAGSLVAGCGLRVDHSTAEGSLSTGQTGVPSGSTDGPGATGNAGAGDLPPGAAGAQGPGSGPGVTGAGAVADGGTTGAVYAGTTGGAAGTVTLGRGVTDKTITIGFQVSKDLQAAFNAVGAKVSAANEAAIVDALVKWVNSTGGIGGRKLIPVVHETDPTSGTWASQAQAACSDFTEDHKVFAVGSSPVGGSDALLSCLAAKDVPLIEQNLWFFDDEYYKRFPGYLYQPGRASPTRWAKAYAEGLDRMGYFAYGAKVGLLRFDAPVFTRITEKVLKPAMAAHGHSFVKEVAVREPSGVSDFGGMAAELNNAIVTFRSAGVDHLMFLENAGEIPFFFMQQADSQSYRPIYGLTSADIPETQAAQQPPAQLKGSMVVGWQPPNDTYEAQHPKGNPAWDLCKSVMKKYGVSGAGFYVDSICDTVLFLRTVLPKVTSFSTAGLREAAAGLGTSYTSPMTFATSFGRNRFDGATTVRGARFDDACTCYKYVGSTSPM
jgi:ABC-type branched-subunit amino acid transport system substrate-binding protein